MVYVLAETVSEHYVCACAPAFNAYECSCGARFDSAIMLDDHIADRAERE